MAPDPRRPELLLTNHHVLTAPETAEQVVAEFAAEVDADPAPRPRALPPRPDTLFPADRELDFALVRVHPGPDGSPPGDVFGWNPLLHP